MPLIVHLATNVPKNTQLFQNHFKFRYLIQVFVHTARSFSVATTIPFLLKSLSFFYFPEFPSWPSDFKFMFISFTPKREQCILIYERYQYSSWARARLCWPSNKRDVDIRWSDRGTISGMRCTKITQQSGRYQPNGWNDNYLCVRNAPYV